VTTKFWQLSGPRSTARLAEWVPEEMDLETVVCPASIWHQRGGKRLTDLSIALRGKNDVQDFVWTWLSECLFQDRVLGLFRVELLTGFEVESVKARFKRWRPEEPPTLWELVVTGWAGVAPPESGIKLVTHCDACRHRTYSDFTNPEALIDESQWDGSDFFMVWPLPGFVFVSERAAQLIRRYELTGCVLEAVAQLKYDNTGLTPGRLSYWMPDTRAHELGDPLGIY
jgi:hypothetical protein